MPRQRSASRSSRGIKRWWVAAAIAVSVSVSAVVIVANGHDASPSQALSSSFHRGLGGSGRGGSIMMTSSGQSTAANGASALSQQARQQLSVKRETPQQFLAAYDR